MVETKHAPLTYDATAITSHLVLLYNAQGSNPGLADPRQVLFCYSHGWASRLGQYRDDVSGRWTPESGDHASQP
eukprot:scaffold113909_cov60-Phaeocystis_antarctica.AAC.3